MQNFPHHHAVMATGSVLGDIELNADRLPPLRSGSPPEFDGPPGQWSPETLLVAAVGDCFILTFRAVARASGLAWTSLACRVSGTLDRVERTKNPANREQRDGQGGPRQRPCCGQQQHATDHPCAPIALAFIQERPDSSGGVRRTQCSVCQL
jgi:OsmC-like protein